MSTRQIITLGTPHHGAPLAKAVHAAAWALHAFPETEPMAHVLDTRSAGISAEQFITEVICRPSPGFRRGSTITITATASPLLAMSSSITKERFSCDPS